MPKIKWDGPEEPTINNFYKIDNRKCSFNTDDIYDKTQNIRNFGFLSVL